MSLHRHLVRLLPLALIVVSSGCQPAVQEEPVVIDDQEFQPLTVDQIKQAVGELQLELPIDINDDVRLMRATCDYNGSVTFWYCVSDTLSARLRKLGTTKFKERMKKLVEDFDAERFDVPEELAELVKQDHVSFQYVFENRYQTHLGSISLNRSAIDGEERIGKAQTNPFAVNNVSLPGNP